MWHCGSSNDTDLQNDCPACACEFQKKPKGACLAPVTRRAHAATTNLINPHTAMVVQAWLHETFHKAKTMVIPMKKTTTNDPETRRAATTAFSRPANIATSNINSTFVLGLETEVASPTTIETPTYTPATVENYQKVITMATDPCHVTARDNVLASHIWFRTSVSFV